MKSDARKSSARSKSSTPATVTPAIAEELIDTAVNIEVADADYAAQLLTAAEALEPKAVKANKPAAKSKSESIVAESVATESVADVVVLPSQCLMRDAIDLKKQLLPKLGISNAVKIDISKLERIDAAALQVLVAFVRDRSQQQQAVEWLGMNEVMTEAAKTLGLESLLQLGAAA